MYNGCPGYFAHISVGISQLLQTIQSSRLMQSPLPSIFTAYLNLRCERIPSCLSTTTINDINMGFLHFIKNQLEVWRFPIHEAKRQCQVAWAKFMSLAASSAPHRWDVVIHIYAFLHIYTTSMYFTNSTVHILVQMSNV